MINNNLPTFLMRVKRDAEEVKQGGKFKFTSSTRGSKLLFGGANVIAETKIDTGIRLLGVGQLGVPRNTGVYSTYGIGKYYESIFDQWYPCQAECVISLKRYSDMLNKYEVHQRNISIKKIPTQVYSALLEHMNKPSLSVRQDRICYDEEMSLREAFKYCRSIPEKISIKIDEVEEVKTDDAHVVSIFYGTDREFGPKTSMNNIFTGERSDFFQLGTAEVSVPKAHKVGNIEKPPFWKIGKKRRDSSKYMLLIDVKWLEEAQFIEELSLQIRSSAGKDALVFIHGYNVCFKDAALRTAQIAYDLKFQGAPILYSWPSKGCAPEYFADEATIEWAVDHLTYFLKLIAKKTGAEIIHLIGHSMGNRALVHAMKNINNEALSLKPLFNQVMLTAPDIDAGVFKNLSKEISLTAQRLTLYASSNDKAIQLSQDFHDYPRIGQTMPQVTIVDGVDTIDASNVETNFFNLGHCYAAESRSVLNDIYDLIQRGDPPDNRFNLIRQNLGGLVYWAFKP